MSDDRILWLDWAREIQAMSQTGLTYSTTGYDIVRYRRLMEIAAEMTALGSGLPVETFHDDFLSQPGYATPKLDVRGAITNDDGHILLVRERSDGGWCLPGGWADVGETPSEMVIREVREESGLDVKPVRLVGVYDANRSGSPLSFFHAYKLVFMCEKTGGKLGPSDETSDAGYFPFDSLPRLSRERTGARHLADIERCLADPARPAAFD